MEDRVTKVKPESYERIASLAKEEGISMAEAAKRLIERSPMPTTCEAEQFKKVLEGKGMRPPRRLDWLWGMTDVLPGDLLAGSKLEPYAEARKEAELRCRLGDELYQELLEKAEEISEENEEISKEKAEETTPW